MVEERRPARMWQTFIPGVSNLTAVDIDIISANPFFGDETLTVEVAKDGVVLASAARAVEAGYDGLLQFKFEDTVTVKSETPMSCASAATGERSAGGTGPTPTARMRYMNSQADPTADWFFQTHGFGAGNAKPAAVPTTIEKVSGDNQSGPPGSKLASPLVVRVKDQNGQTMVNVQVDFVITAGDGTLEPSAAVTGSDGCASTQLTLGRRPV